MSNAVKNLATIAGPLVKDIFHKWSTCQSKTLRQQLEGGIRYFDMRIGRKPQTEDIFVMHGLYGRKLEVDMQEMADFIKSHPKEVVLLDFNHMYEMDEPAHLSNVSMILETFGDAVCPLLDMASMTLETMWENGLQVVVFYHQSLTDKNMMLWPGSVIPNPWPNTESLPKLLAFLEASYQNPRPPNRFHVTQGILTPTAGYIMRHMTGSLQEVLAQKVAASMVEWIKSKKAGRHGINICILDFVEMADFIPTVIGLNTVVKD